ncbi:dolichyl-diphosphooligosaccharide--protein glycosyltransferase [Desulfobaculum xiamenense]|uniref:Dolichyl-diphosphooligosaccharide--protein glycosyltransferase n=1 Tax=Desulfobaculum xiamenense TaxID=995050 RepID=A0A846QR44_9BACT|nr:STT3 domain-containing protein [Desulfobaculum xiamenense]NJB67129.1 dolichyl-diphosphooligosaccharide--protein glycosyltransferase [Desulfobaculum xiamenense]
MTRDMADEAATGSGWSRAKALGVLAAFAASYAVAVTLHMAEVPAWLGSGLTVDGEFIMATHDAYAWMAGAMGTGRLAMQPMSRLLEALAAVSGAAMGNVAFWIPPFAAALAALPACLIAARLIGPSAGVPTGIAAAAMPGFYMRTRVGFCDTDILTLFLPLCVAAGLLTLLAPLVRETWRPADTSESLPADASRLPAGGLAVGVGLWLYTWFYGSGFAVGMALCGFCGLAGLVLARPGMRWHVVLAVGGAVGSWLLGPWSWPLFACGAAVVWMRPELIHGRVRMAALVGLLLAVTGMLVTRRAEVAEIATIAAKYLGMGPVDEAVRRAWGGLNLPSVIVSVREATRPEPARLLMYMAGHWSVALAGVAGYLWLVLRRPVAIMLLPFLGMGLSGYWLGTRFTMYSGVALGLGLGWLADVAARAYRDRRATRWVFQAGISCLAVLPLAWNLGGYRPIPVLSPAYAQTLRDIGRMAKPDAELWQWWDFGYAAQYYAGRETFGDGARQEGDFLYPLAKVHTTPSPLQAWQIMRFMAAGRAAQAQRARAAGVVALPGVRPELYPYNPVEELAAMGPRGAEDFVRSLAVRRRPWPDKLPEQYFVVSWENLRIASWITRFGLWNLASGPAGAGRSRRVGEGVRFDLQRGIAFTDSGSEVHLTSLDMVDERGRLRRHSWPTGRQGHVVADERTGEMLYMDGTAYGALMTRMLLGDPADFEPYFTLVVDRGPMVRAYRLNADIGDVD